MRKIEQKSEKIIKFLSNEGSSKAREIISTINFRKIGKDIKGYFFTARGEKGKIEKVRKNKSG